MTVTYGTTPALYLSIRVLRLHATTHAKYSLAAKAIMEDTYVDDALTGADDELAALKLRDELITLLAQAFMPLEKWVSNRPAVSEGLPENQRLRPHWIDSKTEGPMSALGVCYALVQDEFCFQAPDYDDLLVVTMRLISSFTSRLFDAPGWIAAVIIRPKIIMQGLWKDHINH